MLGFHARIAAGVILVLTQTATVSTSFATSFSVEVVVSDGSVGSSPSLVIASDGSPYIAYNDDARLVTMLAHEFAGLWSTEEVSPYAHLFPTRALALTSAGDPVVAFGYNDLTRVGSRSGGIWLFEDFDGYSPWWLTLALDAADGAHVGYVWSWGSGLYEGYFHYDREGISGNVFLPTNTSCSLVMDSNARPHIVFTPTAGVPMQYWTKSGFTWESEPLPVGTWGVLALDATDTPHIVYYDHQAGDLVYGQRTLQGWTFETVDAAGDVGKLPSLAVDTNGNPHVSYHDVTNGDLKYASRNGAAWSTVAVDAAGDVGTSSSVALAQDGMPAIAYYDATKKDLKFALGALPLPARPTSWGAVKAMYRERPPEKP